jgi:uncharacterized protein (DUF2236 family)
MSEISSESSSQAGQLPKEAPSEKPGQVPSIAVDPELLDALEKPQEIYKVVQEGILLAGGAAAILLQVANPGVAKGVNEHSYYEQRPLDRLRTTMIYVYCMVYGTRQEKEAVIAMVNKVHARVKGLDYSADDPHLQTWVAATLYAVGTDLYQRIFGYFDEKTAERIYLEYALLAVSLRVPPELWPKTRKDFWAYWNKECENLEVTDHARDVSRGILYNKNIPFGLRAVLPLARVMTAEMLPLRIREEFGFKSTKLNRAVYKVTLGLTKVTYPALPKAIRTYPKRYYMKDMRRHIKQHA